jgi:hypothetical protein
MALVRKTHRQIIAAATLHPRPCSDVEQQTIILSDKLEQFFLWLNNIYVLVTNQCSLYGYTIFKIWIRRKMPLNYWVTSYALSFFLKENALSTYKAVGGKIRTWSMLLHGSLIPVLPWALRY